MLSDTIEKNTLFYEIDKDIFGYAADVVEELPEKDTVICIVDIDGVKYINSFRKYTGVYEETLGQAAVFG